MDVVALLNQKINMPEIRRVVAWADGKRENLDCLWKMSYSENSLTGVNALWAMTHLASAEAEWFELRQNELTDMLLSASRTSRKRMLLQILKELNFQPETMRTDLLDYCLSKINSECEPHSIRAFSIYVAFKMCRYYPELLSELKDHLSMMSQQPLSPGLTCARRKTLAAIKKLEP